MYVDTSMDGIQIMGDGGPQERVEEQEEQQREQMEDEEEQEGSQRT